MNVERLHRILIDLNNDLKTSKLLSLLQAIRSDLQNQVNSPSEPSYQTNFVNNLQLLFSALDNSKYNSYSPSWKETIEEINMYTSLGFELKAEIQDLLAQNTITPAKALEEITALTSNFETFEDSVTETLSGFEGLGIEHEELEPGECELGYTIPRLFIKNKLPSLKKEIGELNFILNSLSEAVEGEKKDYEVKTISSSDFLLYILVGLSVADVLAKATERILNLYKQVLEIKNLRNQLKEKGIPSNKTKSIETHANGMMEDEIRKIAKEVILEHYKGNDPQRKNELENSVTISLNKLANRIDNGFNIEIRVEPLPITKTGETITPQMEKNKAHIASIQKSAKNIQFIETTGQSILELPEKSAE